MEENSWFNIAIGETTVAQWAALLVAGVAWSALLWRVTDLVKLHYDIEKPYSPRVKRRLLVWPLVISCTACLIVFPGVLMLFGIPFERGLELYTISAVAGLLGWATAKVWHDFLREVFVAGRVRLLRIIAGSSGGKDGGT